MLGILESQIIKVRRNIFYFKHPILNAIVGVKNLVIPTPKLTIGGVCPQFTSGLWEAFLIMFQVRDLWVTLGFFPVPSPFKICHTNSENPSVFWISSRILSSIMVHPGLPLCDSKNQFYFVLTDKNTLWYYYLLRWIFTITSTTPGSFSTLFYKKSN